MHLYLVSDQDIFFWYLIHVERRQETVTAFMLISLYTYKRELHRGHNQKRLEQRLFLLFLDNLTVSFWAFEITR